MGICKICDAGLQKIKSGHAKQNLAFQHDEQLAWNIKQARKCRALGMQPWQLEDLEEEVRLAAAEHFAQQLREMLRESKGSTLHGAADKQQSGVAGGDVAGSGGGGVGELDRKHINDRGGSNGSSTGLVK